jgi:histidine triad (HIT) family protein
VFVIEPVLPVTPGHALVVPRRHVADALEDPALTGDVVRLAAVYARSLRLSGVEACNIITSVGPEATQSVFHLHVHVVPRREGDGLPLPWSVAPSGLTL